MMKKLHLLSLSVVIFCFTSTAQVNTGDFDVTYTESGSGATRTFSMYVPSDYDSMKSYPFLYAWHGQGMTGSQMRAFIKSVNGPIGAIICCTDVNGMTQGSQLTQMINESLGYVNGNYKIDESARVITGFSMGGNYAFQIGLLNPAQFDGIIGLSPAIGSAQVSSAMWDNILNINMATILGDQDFNYTAVNQLMQEIINKGGFLVYKVKPGVTHSDNVYFNSQEFKDDYYECWEKVLGISSIQEGDDIELKVAPNPFVDHITVTIPGGIKKKTRIELFDANGKMVLTKNMSPGGSQNVCLQMPVQLNAGVYILRIKTAESTRFVKLIRE